MTRPRDGSGPVFPDVAVTGSGPWDYGPEPGRKARFLGTWPTEESYRPPVARRIPRKRREEEPKRPGAS